MWNFKKKCTYIFYLKYKEAIGHPNLLQVLTWFQDNII